jgi:Zn-dependent protease
LLYALGRPVAFVGLLVAFLLALVLRAYAIRITARVLGLTGRESVRLRPREDIDPFGAVAAAVGGAGWGKVIDVDEVPRDRGRGRAAAVFAAGPVVTLLVSQLFFLAYALLYGSEVPIGVFSLGGGLRGLSFGPYGAQFLESLACGLLGFGLLALIPVPPLDGFGLLWSAQRHPGPGMQGYRLWFQEKNIGVVVLLACCFFPFSNPLILLPLDLIGRLFLRLWG